MFANKTKEVTLYSYDNQGVLSGEFQYLWVVGTGLASNSTLTEPLEYKDSFSSVWNGSKWEYKENHLDKTIYNTETKESKKVDYVGEIQQGWTLLEPIAFGEWNGSGWVDNRTEEERKEYERSLMPDLNRIEFKYKLHKARKLEEVENFIATTDDFLLRLAYNEAHFFKRTDSLLTQALDLLGWTAEKVDELWTGVSSKQ